MKLLKTDLKSRSTREIAAYYDGVRAALSFFYPKHKETSLPEAKAIVGQMEKAAINTRNKELEKLVDQFFIRVDEMVGQLKFGKDDQASLTEYRRGAEALRAEIKAIESLHGNNENIFPQGRMNRMKSICEKVTKY